MAIETDFSQLGVINQTPSRFSREIERPVPPDRVYLFGGDTIDDYVQAGILTDVTANILPPAQMPQLRFTHMHSEEIYRTIGLGGSHTKHLWNGSTVILNQGKYSSLSVKKDYRQIPWIVKTYTTVDHTSPEYSGGNLETGIPLHLASRIVSDILEWSGIVHQTAPGLNLPLGSIRILQLSGEENCYISLEQVLLTHGTLRDALQPPSREHPNEHWGHLGNVLRDTLNIIAQVLTTRTQFHQFMPNHILPAYTDLNPANLAIVPEVQEGKLMHRIFNVDYWPPSLLGIGSLMPRTFRISPDEEYNYVHRRPNEVIIRYFTRFGAAANFIRGLKRVLEVTGNDDRLIWEKRIKPEILKHQAFMNLIAEYFLPTGVRAVELRSQIIEILATNPLYDINDVNKVRKVSGLPPMRT